MHTVLDNAHPDCPRINTVWHCTTQLFIIGQGITCHRHSGGNDSRTNNSIGPTDPTRPPKIARKQLNQQRESEGSCRRHSNF